MKPRLPWDPPHPLDAAYLRHERSREHFVNLQAAVDDYVSLHAAGNRHGQALAYLDAETGSYVPLPWYATAPLDITFALSELFYNLKVSLDYVAYALFKQALAEGRISSTADFNTPLDFNAFEERVKFPIMDFPKSFRKWEKENRKWIGREGTTFERAQPYKRPLFRLLGDEYHNLDKHRDLQPLIVEIDLSQALFRETGATTGGDDFQTEGVPIQSPVYVYVNGSVEVLLPDRTPVIEAAKVLETEVSALIDAFSLAFK